MARSGCWSCSSSSRRRSLRWAVRRGDTWTPPDARAGGRRQLRAEVAPPAASRSPRSMSPRSMRLERTPPSHQQAGAASCGRRWRRRPPAARRARCAELNAASAPAGGRHRRRTRCTGPGCRRPPRQMIVASCERGGSRRPPAARRARPGCRRQHAESGRARRLPARGGRCCPSASRAMRRRPRYRGDIAVGDGAISPNAHPPQSGSIERCTVQAGQTARCRPWARLQLPSRAAN